MQLPEFDVVRFQLTNGVNLLVAEQHTSPVASVQAWCETGSIHESEQLGAGLTHLLEHMLFKGTATRSATEISEQIHQAGGYMNAYTSFDRTVFWVDCPAAAVELSLEILGDMLFQSRIDPADLAKEMDVIRREFEMGYDDPDRVLSHLAFATAYQRHPSRYPVIGLRRIFDRTTHAEVMSYYRSRCVPDNVFVVVTGDVIATEVRDWANQAFGQAESAPLRPVLVPSEPQQLAPRTDTAVFSSQLGYFALSWHIPAVTDPDMPAVDLLALLMGGGVSSFLYQKLREEEGFVHALGAYAFSPAFPGLFTISGTCPPEHLERLPDRFGSALNEWRSRPLSEHDLAKAKRLLQVGAIEQLQTVRGLASDIGLSWLYARSPDFNRHYLRLAGELDSADVVAVFDRYLRPENESIATLRPSGDVQKKPSRTVPKSEPELRLLPNGLPVVLIPDPRLPLIQASFVTRGGVLVDTPKTSGLSRFYAHSLIKGTQKRTAAEIAEATEALGATLFADSGYNTFRLGFGSLTDDFPELLQLAAEILDIPSFEPGVIERERAAHLALIEAEAAQPVAVGRKLLRAKIYGQHPYGLTTMGRPETVRALGRENLVDLHRQLLEREPSVLAVCGNFEVEKLIEQLATQFAFLPSSPAGEFPPGPKVMPVKAQRVVHRHERHQAFVAIGYLASSLYSPDRIPFEILDEATSDASSRFFVRIREEEGLAYSVGTSLALGISPGLFSGYASTAPAESERVAALLQAEIDLLAKIGLSVAEFERARTKLSAQLAFQKQHLEGYAHGLALNQLYGFGLSYIEERQQRIAATTLEEVQEVCQKYLMDKPAVTVIVRP